MAWQIDPDLASKHDMKKYLKHHPREFESCFEALRRVFVNLNNGMNLQQCASATFKALPGRIFEVKNEEKTGSKETRLYLFFDEVEEVAYILGIGDKDTQSDDINEYKKLVRKSFPTGKA